MRVLFVCVGNSCRSQMAEGFARALGKGAVEAFSAGSRPAGFVSPAAVEVMREKGIDLSGARSKGLDAVPQGSWDALVTMGCGDACPTVPARRRLDWEIPDPIGLPLPVFRKVRDQIEARVAALLKSIKVK